MPCSIVSESIIREQTRSPKLPCDTRRKFSGNDDDDNIVVWLRVCLYILETGLTIALSYTCSESSTLT